MAEVQLAFPSSSSSSSCGAAMDYQLLCSQFPSVMAPGLRSNRFGLEFSPSMKAFPFPKGCKGIEAVQKNSHETWWEKPFTPLLDSINFPLQLKSLNLKALKQLADEVRLETICAASESGVDSGSSLSVVELTIALHYVFNTPEDKIIWDMGHQTIPHKILTGRRSRVHTIRKKNGLSGFPKRSESEYDPFGSGHTSSSISAGLGMAAARDLKGKRNHIVSIIGDLAMTAGQAYEAMNNAGYLDTNMIVILNDNKREVSRTLTENAVASSVGRLGSAFSKIQSNRSLRELREFAKGVTKSFGGSMHEFAAKVDEYARGMISGSGSSFFEELGLYYIGPVDGHNIDDLVTILREVKEARTAGPVLIHVITEKGRGRYNEKSAQNVSGYRSHSETVSQKPRGKRSSKLYTNYFAEALIAEAEIDKDIVGIHAAMAGGTGLNMFAERFPNRCFDVGIAEQHAVTFAAGLACEGMKPFCAIHSSFLQRAYDQVVHDVDLQNLPVRFALDRAGLVGPDGPTHCGAFDVTYMACLPNMVVMAPSDEADLIHMVATAIAINDRPSCIRYPRGYGVGVPLPTKYKGTPLEIGRGRVLTEGTQVALLGYGAMVQNCLVAESILAQQYKVSTTVFDARFCKPLDCQLIRQIAKTHEVVITVEEGSVGGFGSHVAQFLALDGLLDGKLKVRPVMLPDRYIEHASPAEQLAEAGLTAAHIAATVLNILGRTRDALQVML